MTDSAGAAGVGGASVEERADPPWLDRERYPFESRWYDAEPGRMHYVDAGGSETTAGSQTASANGSAGDHAVVALHGNPTWSFMYRRLIRSLAPEHRVVAPDMLGFGLSETPPDFSYRAPAQAAAVAGLLDSLDADELTLVVHDWGGPVGLSYAVDNPDRVRALVVCNTFCWPADRAVVRAFSYLAGGPVGRVACGRYNAFARWLMPTAFAEKSRFPADLGAQYVEPLARADRRTGTWRLPRDLTAESAWLADRWERREAIADTPALLVWGMADAVLGEPALDRFRGLFRDVRTERLDDVSHYVPEEGGERFVDRVEEFLDAEG